MTTDRERLQKALEELEAELQQLENVAPEFRQRLEHTLDELRQSLDEGEETSSEEKGFVHRLTESARHFEETHPNLSGMIGSIIDTLGRMGI